MDPIFQFWNWNMDFLKFALARKLLVATANSFYFFKRFPRLFYVTWTRYLGSKFILYI